MKIIFFSRYLLLTVAIGLSMLSSVRADALIVALDISGSSPVTNKTFVRSVMPSIAESISRLPIGSRVKVFSVGDDKATPLEIHFFVQRDRTSEGDTAKELSIQISNMLTAYLERLRNKPSDMQGESSLSPAFLDASKWCQVGKPCSIVFLTDGLEHQPGVISWPREYNKPLPLIAGLDLKKASVFMYGVGQGAPSFARIPIEDHWTNWLKSHNAGNIDLRRL
jgi:hypothetical protein